jgi:hypothetical protein
MGITGIFVLFPLGLDATKKAIETSNAKVMAESVYNSLQLATEKMMLKQQEGEGSLVCEFFQEGIGANPDPPYTAGPGSFTHDLIVRAGGRNCFEDLGCPWGPVDWEAVLARNPEYLLIPRGLERHWEARPGRASLNGRVFFVDPDLYVRPTMRTLQGLKELSRWMHPDGPTSF